MRARIPAGLALSLTLAACQLPVGGPPTPPLPSAAKSAKPVATPSGTPSAAAPAGTLLRTLPGNARTLAGSVMVDARYAAGFGGGTLGDADGHPVAMLGGGQLVGNAGGTLVGNAGGTLVGNAGGTLVGNAGGTLVGNAGGTLVVDGAGRAVAANGGNVVVPAGLIGMDGSTLIGMDGSTLIGNDGSTLIGMDGSTLIGNDGSTLVAGGPQARAFTAAPGARTGTYRLAQAPAAAAFGEARPAVGMWLSVVDARTGFTVPLGSDAAGKPVYTVYTDLAGGFKVQIPDTVDAPRVVARAPGLRDPKLVLTVLPKAGADIVIDAQQAATTAFFRNAMRGRLLTFVGLGLSDAPEVEAFKAALAGVGFGEVQTAFNEIRAQLGDDRIPEVGNLMADALLADVDIHALKLSTRGIKLRHPASAALEGRDAVAEIAGVLRRIQEATARQAQGATDPATFFAAKPYLIAENLLRAPGARFRIDSPADMTSFIGEAFVAGTTERDFDGAYRVMEDLGLDLTDRDRLAMANTTIYEALFRSAIGDPDQGEAIPRRLAALLRDTGAKLARAPRPAAAPPAREALPLPAPPAPEADGIVDTLPIPIGHADGLATDPSAPGSVLYVCDAKEATIRQVTFDAAGAPVVRVLAKPALGSLAHDGKGSLYAMGAFGLFRISTREADFGATERLLEGWGDGYQDGPGASARFGNPSGIAVEPRSGDLLVADLSNNRIRRIAVNEPALTVTTFAGSGFDEAVEGPLAPGPAGTLDAPQHPGAAFNTIFDLDFGADGTLFTVDGEQGLGVAARPTEAGSRLRVLAGGRRVGAAKPTGAQDFYHNADMERPNAVAVGPDGKLVLADTGAHRIRLVTPDGWVQTLAGSRTPGKADGVGAAGAFNIPDKVAVGADGTVFVHDRENHVIRRIRRPGFKPRP